MNTSRRILSFTGITFVMLVWGLSFLSIKVAVVALAPMTLALSRFVIASLMLWFFLKVKEPGSKLDKRDFPRMALSGIVGITIYFFFENNGVMLTTTATASIIIGTIPILTILSDFLFYRNKIGCSKGLGVILSFLGVYLIVRNSGEVSLSSQHFVGNLLMFGAALAWVVYSLLTRPLGDRYSRLAITTYQTLFGTITILPFVFFETNNWQLVDWTIIGNVVFLGVFCSALGYYLYVKALGDLGVALSSLFVNLIPVVTVVAGYLLLDEKITSIQVIGGSLIVLAVYLADLSNLLKLLRNKPLPKPTEDTVKTISQ